MEKLAWQLLNQGKKRTVFKDVIACVGLLFPKQKK